MSNQIIIAGGSGFLGQTIVKYLQKEGESLTILTRGPSRIINKINYIHWDSKNLGDWARVLESAKAIINLTGKSVNCRYTPKNKKLILSSRVDATNVLAEGIQKTKNPPKVWINASSIALFGYSDKFITNEAENPGEGFSADVCRKWEQEYFKHQTPNTKRVILRLGVVLQKDIGLLQPFSKLIKLGFGGNIGSGEQYFSWIHEEDFINILKLAIYQDNFQGAINCTSPNPIKNKEFMQALRKLIKHPYYLNTPPIMAKIGLFLNGTQPELILRGRRVSSDYLQNINFKFKYPDIQSALSNLLHSSKQ
ncbi:hypothetical protein SAMN05192529_10693 [Arachidicoccus rhizosphaerae]|uniref:TIGR01777 family protein n=1 Tax=Arachidicoccus rhizosphaerae TaxID=551991 RepID=A0A1H3XS96_9BACT|nr:TIGR01777 family oxidoreductase [Arachidicoccus rhizosphaerae]SEA02357.1 hypothetical protein SAMN05192529_10693 [Arachidicoccus rhizosphaerae]